MESKKQLNDFLVKTFNELLKIEESYLSSGDIFKGLSIREIHVIEEVCRAVDNQLDNRASVIAAAQMVTAGTLTTTLKQLEKKGYITRTSDPFDKRIVRIYPTEAGVAVNQQHTAFHIEMVDNIIRCLNADELNSLVKGLGAVDAFFKEKYKK